METIVGVFNSLADARRSVAILETLGLPDERIAVLTPHTSDAQVEASVPTDDTEQPGMGQAIGGAVGAAMGVAGGVTAGAAVASLLVPGVGPVIALGLLGAAVLGTGGAAAGAVAGEALDKALVDGLPRDELFLYEDALRRGRTVVVAFADDDSIAENARAELARAGAETVDAAREEWWTGLRGPEQEHYTSQGGDFNIDEARYRLGFEAALHPDRRGKSAQNVWPDLERKYGVDSGAFAFRQGYDRGQRYQALIAEHYGTKPGEEKSSKRAA